MKFDWAMQISIALGVVVTVAAAFTFDHNAAERREALATIGERFEAGEYLEFALWRPLAANLLDAPTPEREITKFARRVAGGSPLDEHAIAGVAWYWVALRELGNNGDAADDITRARYERALENAIEHLNRSEAREDRDPGVRYAWGHYAGRAAARLEDPGRAALALPVALDAAEIIAVSVDPAIAYRHIETLADSYHRVGDEAGSRAAWDIAIRVQFDRLDLGFDPRAVHNEILRRLENDEQRDRVRAYIIDAMQAWLEEHGESARLGRSYIHLGWHHSRLGDQDKAEHAWRTANDWWEANKADATDRLDLYNLARSRALVGKHDAALDALAAAVERGFTDLLTIHQDPDLAAIRDTDRFRAITARADEIRNLRADAADDETRVID